MSTSTARASATNVFPVAIGRHGWETPTGSYHVANMRREPDLVPTQVGEARGAGSAGPEEPPRRPLDGALRPRLRPPRHQSPLLRGPGGLPRLHAHVPRARPRAVRAGEDRHPRPDHLPAPVHRLPAAGWHRLPGPLRRSLRTGRCHRGGGPEGAGQRRPRRAGGRRHDQGAARAVQRRAHAAGGVARQGARGREAGALRAEPDPLRRGVAGPGAARWPRRSAPSSTSAPRWATSGWSEGKADCSLPPGSRRRW